MEYGMGLWGARLERCSIGGRGLAGAGGHVVRELELGRFGVTA